MFTGIIEYVGRVQRLTVSGGAGRLRVDVGPLIGGIQLGDSVAVDGACLTAALLASPSVEFDVSAETLKVTTLGGLRPGSEVNLERALRVGDRLGGHFVLGHVDALGTVHGLNKSPEQITLDVQVTPEIAAQLIYKGSIAVAGISLTIAELAEDRFSVAVIPHTWANTTLRGKSQGDPVNLELDVIGKYVARLLRQQESKPSKSGLSEGFLAEHGFV